MTRLIVLIVLGTLVLGATGCASIMGGSRSNVFFSSDPQGAEVLIDGQLRGKTPVMLPVRAVDANMVEFRKEGYESAAGAIPTEMNPWLFGNILFGGLIGLAVDLGSGASQKVSTATFSATLAERK